MPRRRHSAPFTPPPPRPAATGQVISFNDWADYKRRHNLRLVAWEHLPYWPYVQAIVDTGPSTPPSEVTP